MKAKLYILAALGLAAAGFPFAAPAASAPLSDVSESYAKDAIERLYQRGVVKGDGQGAFQPGRAVTRAEFVSMMGRGLGIEPLTSAVPAFRDVTRGHWGYGWIQAYTALGVVAGTGPSSFAPARSVSRQEAATLLVKALQLPPTGSSQPFHDGDQIASWAAPYVSRAAAAGLIQGYQGRFRPNDPITREEAAVLIDRILQKEKKASSASSPSLIHMGWNYNLSSASFQQEALNSATVNTLSPRWFFLEPGGKVSQHADASLVEWAHQRGLKVWPLVGNRFDPEATRAALADQQSRRAVVQQIAGYVRTYRLDGINLDFESIRPEDRERFSLFVAELAAALHEQGALLSVDVPPDTGTTWSAPYDYAALGKSADYLVMMGYDEHWRGAPRAGSVSSLPWFREKLEKLVRQVPASKVIAGVPFYTRDWQVSPGKPASTDLSMPASFDRIKRQGASVQWDSGTGQYLAAYASGGTAHQIWLEESRSLSLKVQTALRLGVAGIAYWHLGSESDEVWPAIRNAEAFEQTRRSD